jgi:hypothetical protein
MRVQGHKSDIEHAPEEFGAREGKPIYDDLGLALSDGFKASDVIVTDNPLVIRACKGYDQNDAEALRRTRFSLNPSHSMWITDETSLKFYTQLAKDASQDSSLPAGELEDFEKIGYQISHKPHWHVPSSDFIVTNEDTQAACAHAVDLALQLFKAIGATDYRDMQPYKPYPNSTNGGAPHYRSGELSFLMDLTVAAVAKQERWEGADYLSKGQSLYKNDLPAHSKATLRAKLTRKSVPILSRRGNSTFKIGESFKITDTRLAYMGQRFVNMGMSRLGANANFFLYQLYSFVHSSPDKTVRIVEHFGTDGAFSLDYSGYDTTMSSTFQQELKRLYKMFGSDAELETWWHQLQSDVLTGPIMGARSIGCLLKKTGQLSSGTRTTSTDGCLLNLSASLYAMQKATGYSDSALIQKFVTMKWGALFWGDDTVIFPEAGFDRSVYLDALGDLGLKATTLDELVFLKKRFFKRPDGTIDWHPIVSRSLQNSICGEYSRGYPRKATAEDRREVKIMTLLRLYARTIGAEKSPAWSIVEPHLTGSQSPVWTHGLDALRKHVESPSFVKALTALTSAGEYLADIEASEGRFIPLSARIMEGAGVTATGMSKLDTIRWLHHPKGAASMTESQKNKLLSTFKSGLDLTLGETSDELRFSRSVAQARTDRLRIKRNVITAFKTAFDFNN